MPSTAPASSARWWCSSIWPQNSRAFCRRTRLVREPIPAERVGTLLRSDLAAQCARGRRDSPARTGHADSDTRHDQRWRERPRQGALGSGAGHGGGVVHAIVGAVTSARALLGRVGTERRLAVVDAATYAASSGCLRFALIGNQGRESVWRGRRNRGANLTRFSLGPPFGPDVTVHRAGELEVLAVQQFDFDRRTAVRVIVAQGGRVGLPEHPVAVVVATLDRAPGSSTSPASGTLPGCSDRPDRRGVRPVPGARESRSPASW